MNASAYRSLDPVIGERMATLRERRARDAVQVDAVTRIVARRVARVAAGWGGVAAALVAFAAALLSWFGSPWVGAEAGEQEDLRATATYALLGGWAIAFVLACVALPLARCVATVALGREPFAASGDAATDLARLEASDPLARAVTLAMRWERSSAALPLVAVALLTPLTLHWVVAELLATIAGGALRPSDYGSWIGLSVAIVGHAHLVLALLGVRWAFRLRGLDRESIAPAVRKAWVSSLGWTVMAACIPGIVLVAIPPLLVALTGVLFVPAAFHAVSGLVARERLALEAAAA